jgi:hypothetical protein
MDSVIINITIPIHILSIKSDDGTLSFANLINQFLFFTNQSEKQQQHQHQKGTTMWCIINLTCQYFFVYTALAVARTYRQTFGGSTGVLEVLQAASGTVVYAPMLCVLFLGRAGEKMRRIEER